MSDYKKREIQPKMKRPKFIIFTDIDGTLDSNDEQFNNISTMVSVKGGMVIPITGRTVGDVEEHFKNKGLRIPQIIVGDNGAVIYATGTKQFLSKKILEHDNVLKIIEDFINNNGDSDFIRYTDGRRIYASNSDEVKEYYEDSKTVKICRDIFKQIEKSEDITKITLAGTEKQMLQISEFVEKLGFWTDIDKTKFPNREYDNCRVDIAQKNINKGEAVKQIVTCLKPKYGYVCIGNGYNDITMLKRAIDDGMIAAIMGNSEPELINEIKEYAVKSKKGSVTVIQKNKNLANKFILEIAKLFERKIKEEEKNRSKNERANRRLLNVQRVNVKGVSRINNDKGINREITKTYR